MDHLQGAIDIHVHSYPDIRPRKLDDIELVEQARAAGMRAILLKSHLFSTGERAYLLNRFYPDFHTFGGIVLNHTVGGFNPGAVEAALKMGAAKVWMPTSSAANHAKHMGGKGDLKLSPDDNGVCRDEIVSILKLIAEHDAILGTGHFSPEESELLVKEAIACGVQRIVITHPEWSFTAVPVEAQKRWAATGSVYFERCLVSTESELKGNVPFQVIVDQIRAIGVNTTIISTDYGLDKFPTPLEGLKTYIRLLHEAEFTDEEIAIMVKKNPARLLKLDE